MRPNVRKAYQKAEARRRKLRDIEARAAGQTYPLPLCRQCWKRAAIRGASVCDFCDRANLKEQKRQADKNRMIEMLEPDDQMPEGWSNRWRDL